MPLEIRGEHFLIRSAQLVRGPRLESALAYRTKISRRAPRSFSSSKWRRLLLVLLAVSSDCFADDAAGAYTAADCTDANLMLTD